MSALQTRALGENDYEGELVIVMGSRLAVPWGAGHVLFERTHTLLLPLALLVWRIHLELA